MLCTIDDLPTNRYLNIMSRILVTGATGKQGGAVIDALLEAKQSTVYALTRSIDSPAAKKLEARGVHLIKGSFTDSEGLVKALKQVDMAFMMTIPASMDVVRLFLLNISSKLSNVNRLAPKRRSGRANCLSIARRRPIFRIWSSRPSAMRTRRLACRILTRR